MPYSFAAESFHTKKLFEKSPIFYTENGKIASEASFGG